VNVKIVTDSVADLPEDILKKLDITTIPLLLRFGEEEFRDGIDITPDEFYEKLKNSSIFPTTAVPSPAVYSEVYDRLAEETDSIVFVTLSAKLSGTYEVARQAVNLMKKKCRVEVIDSQWATMAEGFIVMKAAAAAQEGASLEEVREVVRDNISRVDFLCTFDTLEYLKRGGRIGAARAFLGSMLKINPLITLRDGVVMPAGKTRSRAKAIERIFDFAKSYSRIEEIAVENTACAEEAEALVERLKDIVPGKEIYTSRMTPVIGAHTGPGLLLCVVMGDK